MWDISIPPNYALERFRNIYKELVETKTLSVGDCTLAAKRLASRLRAAGYPDEDLRLFVPDGPFMDSLLTVSSVRYRAGQRSH